MKKTNIFEVRIGDFDLNTKLLVRKRAIAVGCFVSSMISIFGLINYLLIYFLTTDIKSMDIVYFFIIPVFWFSISLTSMIISADIFAKTDTKIHIAYCNQANEEVRNNAFRTSSKIKTANDSLGFCMKILGENKVS